MGLVIHAQPPNAHHRFAVLPRVGGGRCQGRHLVCPITFDVRVNAEPAARVIHDVKFPAVRFRRNSDFDRHRVARRAFPAERVEPLQGGRIDSIFRHPTEMRVDSLLVIGRKQRGRLAVSEIGKTGLIHAVKLPHIRPAMDAIAQRDRRRIGASAVMPPPPNGRAIAGTGKPPLIADGYLADHIAGWTGGFQRLKTTVDCDKRHQQGDEP